jgi:PqqD family protein of HPr-rel-A system
MTGPVYLADPAAPRCVALDGLTLLFHEPSGMTHIVASPAPEILDALREGPADVAALLRRLGDRYAFDGDDAADAVGARLAELEAAGLVRRA